MRERLRGSLSRLSDLVSYWVQKQLPNMQVQLWNGGDWQNVVPQKKPHTPFTQPVPGEQHCAVPQGSNPCGHAARHAPWKQI